VDPGTGAFLTPGSSMGKKSGSESWINNPDNISDSLRTLFGLKFFDVVAGSRMEKFGSMINRSGIRSGYSDPYMQPVLWILLFTHAESRGQKGTGSRILISNIVCTTGTPVPIRQKTILQ
jgi:hypothetical protein